ASPLPRKTESEPEGVIAEPDSALATKMSSLPSLSMSATAGASGLCVAGTPGTWPAGGGSQAPLVQMSFAAHALPQVLQWSALLWRLASQPSTGSALQ